ncbi:c-type cytochrome [Kangiella spongicola]|jgi:cytochrome c553|uniref:Cytochrome c4 n=1 Tax=Kangiella spongicola TaxID=796379 RepID=A0A318D8S3_9GAMM|nr:c-type cytochrome [Kangiella spongicola]MBV34962.1 cytochrome c4 [Rickettsiales bacterium]PXF64188.1 cytochrome c4 [Kangiella spongicola]
MRKLAIFALFFVAWSTPSFAGDVAKGAELANTCAACHGKDGNSGNPMWPKLAGQSEKYLEKQIKDFQAGAKDQSQGRYDASMAPMVSNLSDEDVADLSAYFASQETQMGAVKKEFLELGKKIYFQGDAERKVPACSACHGATGSGLNTAGYPALSGQHPEYTIKQLKAFSHGERSNDANGIMRDIAIRMSDQQIEAVAHFLLGLH